MFDNRLILTSVTSKGQATIPKSIRSLFKIHEGRDYIGFRISKNKVDVVPVTIDTKPLKFTKTEWRKIEKLSNEKGRVFKSEKSAVKFVENL